jgi:DUF1680 family protein
MRKYFICTLSAFLLVVNGMTSRAQSLLQPQLFNLNQVTITGGPLRHAMLLNDSVLLAYNAGRLLQPFEKQAGLTESGAAFSNWAGLDGHVGGHYLSALAISYASCPDATLKARLKSRMEQFVQRLKDCQDAWDKNASAVMHGYVGGVPQSYQTWTTFANGDFTTFKQGWVPFYNVHKIFAGLRDAYVYGGSETAKQMFLKLCDWGVNLISGLTDTQLQGILDIEHGGMNEMFADAYQMTKEQKYLDAAKRYSHRWLLNGMAAGNTTTLDNHHANTQVPKAIGFERIYEQDHTSNYGNAARFFWNDVTQNRTIAVGGNSINEWFPAADKYGDFITSIEGVESCNSYNMLKLSESLFCDSHKSTYADFYEGTMFNHILSTQNPETGGYVYFTPARPQHYRVYSQVNQAMWCCVGSGMENHGKYGEFVYSHTTSDDSLFVNLFVPTTLDWSSKGVTLRQTTNFPYGAQSQIVVGGEGTFALCVRKPSWCSDFQVSINGAAVNQAAVNGYVSVSRTWKDGDKITIDFPMKVSIVPLQNYTDYVAFKYGPILLGAKTSADNLTGLFADESRMGHIANGPQKDLYSAPLLIGDRAKLSAAVVCTNKDSLFFKIDGYYSNAKFASLVLRPFSTIHDSRYMMYWLNVDNEKWDSIKDIASAEEERQQRLEARTVDYVQTGTQQSEVDHLMQTSSSTSGSYNSEYYRDATGWFSYVMNTKGLTDSVSLMVRYWGGDTNRKFTIQVDGVTIATVSLTGGSNAFVNKEYPIPSSLLVGKQTVTVKFVAESGSVAGGVYYIRLCSGYPAHVYKPYVFRSSDYVIGDASRTSKVVYDTNANTLTMTQKSSGNNNISLQMSTSVSGIYAIWPSEYLFTVKGKSLKTTTGASMLWWMNGANHASSVAPTYSVADSDGGTIILWDLRKSGLTDNMNFSGNDEIIIGDNGNAFVNCWGLSSSATNMTATISDINYYSPQEAVDRYPVLSKVLGLTPTGIITAMAPHISTGRVYNMNGQEVQPQDMHDGVFIVDGRKLLK